MLKLVFQDCFHQGTHSKIVSFFSVWMILKIGCKSYTVNRGYVMGCPEIPVENGVLLGSPPGSTALPHCPVFDSGSLQFSGERGLWDYGAVYQALFP